MEGKLYLIALILLRSKYFITQISTSTRVVLYVLFAQLGEDILIMAKGHLMDEHNENKGEGCQAVTLT